MIKEPEANLKQKGILWLTLPSQNSPVKEVYNSAKHLHVTIKFGVSYRDVMKYLNHEPISVKIIENCWNDEIQALKVILPSPFKSLCQNDVPHMTVSHKNGVKPFKSNVMLDEPHESEKLNKSITLYAEFFAFR